MPDDADTPSHDAETIETPAPAPAGPAADVRRPPPGPVPDQIGRYKIKQRIASGGMGTVYLAVQEHPRRNVALKVMKGGIVSADALRRFEFESQILARLRHPNIAHVFEAGTHDAGEGSVPYFAMEYVPGARAIDDFIRAKRLDHRTVLELFTKVCDAVNHGHQKGIIHRDLKPQNILVDSTGEPKVIDFGVARSTNSDVTITTLETNVGQLVGTVQYMSPEQCEADPHDLDIRSDVYALGVVLYELLCGRPPYDVSRAPIYEASRVIREALPARPSTIDRALRGDLETITLTALEKERDRRYQSAAALLSDIQKYLSDEPIDARPPSVVYQFKAYARRHRAVFAASVVVLLVLVVAAVVSLIFGFRARAAEQRAIVAGNQAIRQRDEAVAARLAMQAAKEESDRQRDAALAAEARAEGQAYIVSVAAAATALDDASIETAKRRLDRAAEHLRGWEWRYLANLADQSMVTLRGHEDWVQAVAFSADGSRIVTAGADGAVKLFGAATGEALGATRGHQSPVYGVACSPSGLHAATASADMTIRIWSMSTGDELAVLSGHEGVVTSVAYSPDGARLASVSSDRSIRLWDARTGEELRTIDAGDRSVDCLAYGPGGRRVATGSDDGSVRVWDLDTGAEIAAIAVHDGYVNAVDFHPGGGQLVVGAEDGAVATWDVASGTRLRALAGHAGYVTAVAYSPDGTRIASASEDDSVRLWDAETGTPLAVLHGHDTYVTSLAFSPDGLRLVSGSEDRTARIWDASGFEALGPPPASSAGSGAADGAAPRCLAFTADGRGVAAGRDRSIVIWDAVRGRPLGALNGHQGVVRSIAASRDGRSLATGSDDGTVRLWDASTGEALRVLAGHERFVTSVAFTADSTRLVSGSWDGTVRVWPVSGEADPVVLPVAASVNAVACDDGARVAAGASDGTVLVWDGAGPQATIELAGDAEAVGCVALSRDGARLAAGTNDGTIHLWNALTGEPVATRRAHEARVEALCFSPDGTRLVSGSADATLKVWDAERGDEITALPGQRSAVTALAFSPDGSRLAVGSLEGPLRILDAGSRLDRFQDRVEMRFAASAARRIVDRLASGGLSPAEIAIRVRGDDSLSDAVRHAAVQEILIRGAADAPGSPPGAPRGG